MSDYFNNLSGSVAPGDLSHYHDRVRAALDAANEADRAREYRCLASSPGEFLALAFKTLQIQPQILLHTLGLHPDFRFSINRMTNLAGEVARNKFMEQILVSNERVKLVFMDLRAPADDDLLKQVEERLSVLHNIKGVELHSITRVKYTDNIPLLPVSSPTPHPMRVFDTEVLHTKRTHVIFALMEAGKWWDLLLRPCEYLEQRWQIYPFHLMNYLRGSSELYKTKEALQDRLELCLGGFYDDRVLEKYVLEPHGTLNKFDRQVRLTAAKTDMIRRYLAMIKMAPSFLGPFVDASCHKESQRCDACPESVRVLQEAEEFQADLQSMHSLRSDSHHQVDSSEEVKQ